MVVRRPASSSRRSVSLDFSEMFLGGSSYGGSSLPKQSSPNSRVQRPPPVSSAHRSSTTGNNQRNASQSARFAPAPTPQSINPEWQLLGLSDRRLSTFGEWLGAMLDPSDLGGSNQQTQAVTGFKALLNYQHNEQLRTECGHLWQSEEMRFIRSKLKEEVSKGHIRIREDKDMHADLSLRKEIVSLLMSYSAEWLLLALETVLGEVVVITNDIPTRVLSDGVELTPRPKKGSSTPSPQAKKIQVALQNFVVDRVLADPKVLSKYTQGSCRVPSGRFETKYQAEMRELVLYRLLVLFFFLDRAKHSGLGEADSNTPNLFAENASVKSTRAVLLSFCKNFLSKEGDFVKRLARMGFKVYCRQEPFDEINFGLKFHMEVADPCDGVLLARLTEAVTGVPFKSILVQLKLPATKRSLREYNILHVCKILRAHDASLVDATSVHLMVDGDRGSYLKLIRNVVTRYNLTRLVDEDDLKREIRRIQHAKTDDQQAEVSNGDNDDIFKEGRLRLLLLEWCDAVCSKFGVNVTNLTTDFADGVVICLMIHHYLPSVLPLSEIKRTSRTADFMLPLQRDVGDEIIREHERLNCKLANDRVSTLGRMGPLVPVSDGTHLPDPKAVLLALAYIFSRAPACKTQNEACQTLQRFFQRSQRSWQERRKEKAAAVILKHWISNKNRYFDSQRQKYGHAVRTIEDFFVEVYFKKESSATSKKNSVPRRPSELCSTAGHVDSHEATAPHLSGESSLLRLWQDRIEEEIPDLDNSSCSSSSGTWSLLSAFSFSRSQQGKQPADSSRTTTGGQLPSLSSQWTGMKQEVSKWKNLVTDQQSTPVQKDCSGRDQAFQDLFFKWSSFKTDQNSYFQQIFGNSRPSQSG